MDNIKETQEKSSYIYVKDDQGVQYVCKLKDLKKPSELTEEEKANCMIPPGSA